MYIVALARHTPLSIVYRIIYTFRHILQGKTVAVGTDHRWISSSPQPLNCLEDPRIPRCAADTLSTRRDITYMSERGGGEKRIKALDAAAELAVVLRPHAPSSTCFSPRRPAFKSHEAERSVGCAWRSTAWSVERGRLAVAAVVKSGGGEGCSLGGARGGGEESSAQWRLERLEIDR